MLSRPRLHPWRSLFLAIAIFATSLVVGEGIAPHAAAAGPTYVSGPIVASTTWTPADSPYVVYGHVTIKAGVTLTVLPGTTVRIDPLMAIYVEGTLFADASAASPILFQPNQTLNPFPWIGIQFNATSAGSVSRSSIERPWRAIAAFDASPAIHNNTVRAADRGFHLSGSSSVVADNVVNRAGSVGIYLEGSNAQVLRNRVNGTTGVGIEATASGAPVIAENEVTNTTSLFAFGIEVVGGANADVRENVIRGIRGRDGGDANLPGDAGGGGGYAVGILVTGAPTATIEGNTIDQLVGGRGGNGFENPAGVGGRGGAGGAAAGIAVGVVDAVTIQSNVLSSFEGGRGGNGGGSVATVYGGDGGVGGDVWGIQLFTARAAAAIYSNSAIGLSAGYGGYGGLGSKDGNGSAGGNVFGLFLSDAMQGDATGNSLATLRGGLGGNSTSSGAGTGRGGVGGASSGIAVVGIRASATLHGNDVTGVRGGDGGRGRAGGGMGGNGTGVLVIGYNDGAFNESSASAGTIQDIRGGNGGFSTSAGGDGGTAVGMVMALVTGTTALNQVSLLQGGTGGDASGGRGGRGGDATGFAAVLVPSDLSIEDTVDGSTNGAAGSGGTPQPSYGVGMYFEGNASLSTQVTIENGTLLGVASYDFYAENYSDATTVSTPFGATKARVAATSTLTVRNFVAIEAFWPNGLTSVSGVTIRVEDNGVPVWNSISPTGQASWILVTDRVYINADTATENTTVASVSYLSYAFASNPRALDMSSDRSETFVMIDQVAPSSAAGDLPTYEAVLTFLVSYTADAGLGVDLANITLWYRVDGGPWIAYATQPAADAGSFSFTAPADGLYEFETIAEDEAGNVEPGPSSNDTWTIVDTTRPGSQVLSLPAFTTTLVFAIAWGPEAGVADIATYTIEVSDNGGPWTAIPAYTNTVATSGTYTGVEGHRYAFRSTARDFAGNAETAPAGNDTWTIVDTLTPTSSYILTGTSGANGWYRGPVTVTLTASDLTSGVATTWYRIDGGPWQAYAAPFVVSSDGSHTVGYYSTDVAGNGEAALSFALQIDTAPPTTAATLTGTAGNPGWYLSSVVVTLTPADASSGVASTSYRVDGGAWQTYTVPFIVTGDGSHTVEHYSVDVGGITEGSRSTSMRIDGTRPAAVSGEPRGSNANTTPLITITFSEPMDRASAEAAFRITPDMNGDFLWSEDNRTMTFLPDRSLEYGTSYAAFIDSSAKDAAGNAIAQSYTFSFTTVAAPPAAFGLGDAWPYLVLVAIAVGGGLLFLLLRRRAPKAAVEAGKKPAAVANSEELAIDDVFLLYRKDGILIKHETRRLRPDIDTDILSGMLTAVQQFVRDSFQGDEEGELDEITVGQMHLHIGRGKWLIIAARVSGGDVATMNDQIKRCIQDMEDHNWDRLEDWDGDMELAKSLTPYIRKLIRGEYA